MQHADGQQVTQKGHDLREQIDKDDLNSQNKADLLDEIGPVQKILAWLIDRKRSGFDRHRSANNATW